MPGHLAGEQRAALLQLRLDERMAGLPDGRPAAVALDPRREQARALYVVDDLGARVAAGHDLCEQHELAGGEDVPAVLRHHAEPVAVAVEGEPELTRRRTQRRDEIFQVLRLRGIRVV